MNEQLAKNLREILNKVWDTWLAPFYKSKWECNQKRRCDRNLVIIQRWPPGTHWSDEENYKIWMSNRRYRDVSKILKDALANAIIEVSK